MRHEPYRLGGLQLWGSRLKMKTAFILICMVIAGTALAADNAPPPPDCLTRGTQCYALFSSSPGWVGLRQITGPMDLDKCRTMETTSGTFRETDQYGKLHLLARVALCSPVGHDWKEQGNVRPSDDLTPPDLKRFERNDTYDSDIVRPVSP